MRSRLGWWWCITLLGGSVASSGACNAGGGRDDGALTFGVGTGGQIDTTGGVSATTGVIDDDESGATAPGCPGECSPSQLEQFPCPDGCGEQFRVCNDDCTWSPWSDCVGAGGSCIPGQTQSCGECLEQTCTEACAWGPCQAAQCTFECMASARNGSEICDDEAFDMPDGPLWLVCVTDLGGVGYVSNNTGPVQPDGVARCQGWEDTGQNAWDNLDYVHMIDCTAENLAIPIELAPGTSAWFGVHDQPGGGGHFTEVCIATAS